MKTVRLFIIAGFVAQMMACSQGGLNPFPDLSPALQDELSISPVSIELAMGNEVTFQAGGGVAPYTFSIAEGGGSIGAESGTYTAPDNPEAEIKVAVTDAEGAESIAIVGVTDLPSFSQTFYRGVSGETLNLMVSGGAGEVEYSILSGGGSIDELGLFSVGTLASVSIVQALDSRGNEAQVKVYGLGAPQIFLDAEAMGLNDGDLLSSWTDLSGNGRHATQGDANLQPYMETDHPILPNEKPVVGFVGDTIVFPEFLSFSDATVIIFGLVTSGIQTIFLDTGSDPNEMFWLASSGAGLGFLAQDASTEQLLVFNGVATTFGTFSVSKSGQTVDLYNNGAVMSVTNASFDAGTTWEGAGQAPTLGPMNIGGIGDFFAFQGTLPSTEREAVECYLEAKYLVPVAHSCP